MQKPKIFGYILRLWHMVPKIHGTAVSIKTRKTKKSARTNSKVKPSNQVRIQKMNIEFKQQNKDRSTSYICSHSSSSSRSFSTSDDDDDDDDDDPYFTPRTHHEDFEDLYVPPLMKHNDAGDPYIRRPLVDYRDNNFQISDDQKYAEQLQLEELVFSSASHASASSSSKPPIVSSKLPERYCNICMDPKTESEMFRNTNVCGHMFCFDCIRGHVAAKIQENITKVRCPDPNCKGVIGPEACRLIVPKEVLERWENSLCESLILGSEKFYCPFKDCSALLVDDGGGTVTSSECPNCHRLFCAQCKVTWHSGMSCSEYQSLKKDERDPSDMMLRDLAKNKKWKRCPKCNFYVELASGCLHISCRCGHQFCYGCGKYHPDHRWHKCPHA